MINQLSVYTKNEKGTLRRLLKHLAEANINVLGIVSNDSAEFGTVRILTNDCEKACEVMKGNGYLCEKTEVIGIELEDNVGEMEKLLGTFDDMNINIDYMYVGYRRENSMPIILVHTPDMMTVSSALQSKGFTVR